MATTTTKFPPINGTNRLTKKIQPLFDVVHSTSNHSTAHSKVTANKHRKPKDSGTQLPQIRIGAPPPHMGRMYDDTDPLPIMLNYTSYSEKKQKKMYDESIHIRYLVDKRHDNISGSGPGQVIDIGQRAASLQQLNPKSAARSEDFGYDASSSKSDQYVLAILFTEIDPSMCNDTEEYKKGGPKYKNVLGHLKYRLDRSKLGDTLGRALSIRYLETGGDHPVLTRIYVQFKHPDQDRITCHEIIMTPMPTPKLNGGRRHGRKLTRRHGRRFTRRL